MSNPNKRLLDTITSEILPYPRLDDELVIGLDPRYKILQVVREPAPEDFNPITQRIEEVQTVVEEAGELRIALIVVDLPPPPPPAPNYQGFYNAFLNSATYQAHLFPALLQPGSDVLGNSMTWVGFALQDAMNGRVPLPTPEGPNSLQAAIWAFMSVGAGLLTVEELTELQELFDTHYLTPYYTLTPPTNG